jgi:hypothetical protein
MSTGPNNAIAAIDAGGSQAAAVAYTITLDASITLSADPSLINLVNGATLSIQGAGYPLNGFGLYRGLFVYAGTVTVNNMNKTDTVAKGGGGGPGFFAGGGGAGLGGGLFVAAAGNVTLNNVDFSQTAAIGGKGGNSTGPVGPGAAGRGSGGGGGMGGNAYGGANNGSAPGNIGGGGGGGGIGNAATGGYGRFTQADFQGTAAYAGAGGTAVGQGSAGSGGSYTNEMYAVLPVKGLRIVIPAGHAHYIGGAGGFGGGGGFLYGYNGHKTGAGGGAGGFGAGGGGIGAGASGATGYRPGAGFNPALNGILVGGAPGGSDPVGSYGGYAGGMQGGGGAFYAGGGAGGTTAGAGGYGGGGGGSGGAGGASSIGGAGGYGGGGGGGLTGSATGGFGAGSGGSGGGGGLGAGGGVFVAHGGTLAIAGATESGNTATGGSGADSGSSGSGLGGGIFLASGQVLTLLALPTLPIAIADSIAEGAGSASLLIEGTGTVALSGNNSFSGGIALNGGTLELGGASAAGSGMIAFGSIGATLRFDGTAVPDNTIAGFTRIDRIDLAGISYDAADTVDYLESTGILSIMNGTATVAQLHFGAGNTVVNDPFHLSQDSNGNLLISNNTPCFCAGTRILTDRGPIAVEDLRPGDVVVTLPVGVEAHAQATRTAVWIGHRHVDLTRHPDSDRVRPIRIAAHAMAPNAPERDLLVSPDHALFVEGLLVPARLLVNGGSIVRDERIARTTYYHVELDRHAILLAEGLAAESYLDTGNRGMFENGGGVTRLHADFAGDQAQREAQSCAPLATDPVRVEPIWQRLLQRSRSLGFAEWAAADTVDDPDLYAVVDGRRIRPVSRQNGRYLFVLPAMADTIRLESRDWVPSISALGSRTGAGWESW